MELILGNLTRTAERALATSEASLARLARETRQELVRVHIIQEGSRPLGQKSGC